MSKSNKIVKVKINGELVNGDSKIRGAHLCFDCPKDVMLSCPKIMALEKKSIEYYPFIIEGKQVYREEIIQRADLDGETRKIINTQSFTITKCKRYNESLKKRTDKN